MRQFPLTFNRPMICKHPLERVQLPAGNIHSIRVLGCIQQRELPAQLGCMCRLNARLASRLEELLQPRVPERLNHVRTVARSASRVKTHEVPTWSADAGEPKGARSVKPAGSNLNVAKPGAPSSARFPPFAPAPSSGSAPQAGACPWGSGWFPSRCRSPPDPLRTPG